MRTLKCSVWSVAVLAMLGLAPHLSAECPEGVTQSTNYGSWSYTCPSITNTPGINPTSLCAEKGKAPTVPTVTKPAYGPGQKTRTVTYACHPPEDTTETNSISYTVSGVLWDPPLPTTVTNSFSSQAYVNVTSSDTNGCPSPGRVNIGTAYWTVSCTFSHYTTNCTAGTLRITNVTVTTNGCPNTTFTGSATHVISNAIQVITSNYTNACGNADTNCPATKVTNSIPPTVVTNWWVVTGVGATPPSGSGLSASFTPTNGGNGTLTFYTKWKNGCTATENQTSAAKNFHVGDCPCTTPLSDAEWAALTGAFPNLIRCHTCKEAPATGVYNCMAWTLGITTAWVWAAADGNGDGSITTTEATAYYTAQGIAAGTIAYYGTGVGNVVHVAKKSGGPGADCQASSKLGSSVRISHNLNELEGGAVYGNIVGGN